jgi:hypothetical protein
MKIKGDKKDVEREKGKPLEEGEEKKEKKKKAEQSEGSRYAAFWLLVISVVAGLWFYLAGRGGLGAVLNDVIEHLPDLFKRTYRF